MIDIFTLALCHGLLALAALRLVARDDLDREGDRKPRPGRRARREPVE